MEEEEEEEEGEENEEGRGVGDYSGIMFTKKLSQYF